MPGSTDDIIGRYAAAQHGVVSRTQLLGAGVSADTIDYRVKSRRLRLLHRGVYLVGPLVAPRAAEMAAVLASGAGAVVSHRSAAVLWQLLPSGGASAPIDVTVAGGDRGRRTGIRAHRVHHLADADTSSVESIPGTVVSRTLLDLAALVKPRELEQALAQAERSALVSRQELGDRAAGHRGRRGSRVLQNLLHTIDGPTLTRSEAEERFLSLIRKTQLSRPEANVTVAGYEIDFLWRRERLAVEVDGFAYHASRRQFESDRRRDGRLSAAGIHVMRITWRQITNEPEAVVARLAQALVRSRAI